jgi:glyoxylase-like metal-dependent hydrolase (beta-lactamase superfamily II)
MANLAYLIGSLSTREALVVDPAWSVDALLDRAERDGMKVTGALVTHYHQDHVGGSIFGMEIEGVARLLERAPMPIYVNEHEAEGTRRITGASKSDLVSKSGGDAIELGPVKVRLLHTPGHTPGSQCFLVEEAGQPGRLVSGDTLFLGSCGRVDLPGSDPEEMYRSLNEKLKRLPDETLLYPGHLYSAEPSGKLGDEKRTNPFLRVTGLDQFLMFMGA